MNVLSLFDGISCGQLALSRCGIQVDNYYASEIDKYAISITQYNFPNTIKLGDINNWKEWNIDWGSIDLLIGGSPCQSFSNAGTNEGFDGKSGLFYKYLEILNHLKSINPNIKFLLENVKMKKEWQDIITNLVGVEPVLINSAMLSAQNRKRLYWCNWNVDVNEIKDLGKLLKDIVEENVDEKYDLSLKHYEGLLKSYEWKDFNLSDKACTLLAIYYKQPPHSTYVKSDTSSSGYRRLTPVECERLQTLPDDYTKYGLVLKDIVEPTEDKEKYNITKQMFSKKIGTLAFDKTWNNVRELKDKARTLTTLQGIANSGATNVKYNDNEYYKLTPKETERLQTLPDDYTKYGIENSNIKIISDTQRYKSVGNGWTCKVIEFLFNELIKNK